MPAAACATLDTFLKLRRDLVQYLGVYPRAVRLSARLVDLVPEERRDVLFTYLHRGGPRAASDVLAASTADDIPQIDSAKPPRSWFGRLILWAVAVSTRSQVRRHAPFFSSLTVGETVRYLTPFHRRHSRQRRTHEEVSLKVRMIIAKVAGVPLERVQPETRFIDEIVF